MKKKIIYLLLSLGVILLITGILLTVTGSSIVENVNEKEKIEKNKQELECLKVLNDKYPLKEGYKYKLIIEDETYLVFMSTEETNTTQYFVTKDTKEILIGYPIS